jgi:hypothetical protein
MLTKIVLATALTIGAAGVALASNENEITGGYRELGPGGFVTDGVNPVFHPSLRAQGAKATATKAYGYAPDSVTKHKAK